MNTLEQDVHYSRDVSKPMSQSFSQEIRTASVSPKLDEGTLKLHEIDPVNGLRLTQTSPTGGQLHSPSSNASSTASDASKMTEKQFKRIQRISALFPVQDVPEVPADVNIQQSPSFNYQLNLEHVEQQLAQRERELIKREGVLQAQQSEVRRQIQDLKWQLERRSGELVAQKQRVQVLVQSKVELQTQLESMKQQMSKQQQEFESTLQSFRKSPTRSASKYASKSPTPSNSTFPGTEGFQTPPPNPELESEVQQLRTEVESLRALKGQLAQREQQVMELRRALNIKEEELRQMRAGGVDTLSLQRRISELESALQMQTEESGSLRQQLANLRSSREHLGGKLDTLETQLHLEKIKSAQVKAKLKEVNETTSHGDCDSSGGAEGISGVIDEMEREIERLRDRLSYADSQVEDLTNELRHKDHEMADAHAQLVSLRKNVLTMNNQVVAYASENKELQEKLRSKAATAEIALSQAQRAAHELENLRQENASLQSLKRTFLQRAEAMRIGYLACFALAAHKAFDLQQTLKVCQQSKRFYISLSSLKSCFASFSWFWPHDVYSNLS
eukprot:TRINITY_DN6023_c1_g1_i10.p1 TRINITY_DN6023_c1_g1~~TRINITY_DN6023_c1_g1_i10.p1  ORF type:complete len:561 (-),score=67.38 TRINITY_DN6023_c1_g1_i10:22-1704(-)